ncbi:hypothetical protein ABKN59_002573 [Abortiporus biennis]
MSDFIAFTLNPDNVVNCTLATDEGRTAYTVITEHTTKATFTQTVSLGDWLKKSLIPFKGEVTFSDDKKRLYKWKGNLAGVELELYNEDDKYKDPIAKFHKRRRLPNPEDSSKPPIWTESKLILTERAAEIQDLVVASFLFLEKSRRTNETTSQNRADVTLMPAFNPLGQDYNARNGGV